jgi:hypothetical protein
MSTPTPTESRRSFHDGRDEMNLADFPISALQRQQPSDAAGRKLDRLEFEASRYDPVKRQRVRQKVTLTSSARDGLPTPADEHVILALLCVAKHGDNFAGATVPFAPGQLFEIMGWAPNGRSYTRLRDVLRRLKSLNIRYENAWWDAAGRGYEEEVATGIISAYRIARQVSGPRTGKTELQSWITWTQQFHESLRNGNLKRLNLDVFFQLSSPTAQRMYRFLDKRFYNNPVLAMDLTEFACGHVGLTEVENVAVLKRRLAPALAELEKVGFLAPLPVEERYEKVRAGVWRIHLRAAGTSVPDVEAKEETTSPSPTEAVPPAPRRLTRKVTEPAAPGAELAAEFYRLWDPAAKVRPGVRDLEQAAALVGEHGAETAWALLPPLVQVTRRSWPACRSFSGAVQKYLADALRQLTGRRQREAGRQATWEQQRQEREQRDARQEQERRLAERWDALSAAEREAIRQKVLSGLPHTTAPAAFVQRMCLEELHRVVEGAPS